MNDGAGLTPLSEVWIRSGWISMPQLRIRDIITHCRTEAESLTQIAVRDSLLDAQFLVIEIHGPDPAFADDLTDEHGRATISIDDAQIDGTLTSTPHDPRHLDRITLYGATDTGHRTDPEPIIDALHARITTHE